MQGLYVCAYADWMHHLLTWGKTSSFTVVNIKASSLFSITLDLFPGTTRNIPRKSKASEDWRTTAYTDPEEKCYIQRFTNRIFHILKWPSRKQGVHLGYYGSLGPKIFYGGLHHRIVWAKLFKENSLNQDNLIIDSNTPDAEE